LSWLSPLFEPDRNIKRALGMKPRFPPEKEPIYLISRSRYLNSELCFIVSPCIFQFNNG